MAIDYEAVLVTSPFYQDKPNLNLDLKRYKQKGILYKKRCK